MLRRQPFLLFSSLLASALVGACSGASEGSGTPGNGTTTTTTTSSGGSGGSGTGAGGTGGAILFGGYGGTGGDPGPSVLYAHTNTTFFSGDPSVSPLSLTQIGDFDCVPSETTSMTDVAVNEAGEIWAISATKIYRIEIQGSTVHCAQVVPLDNPAGIRFYGLTFAPKGVLGPSEVLVAGNNAGELWSIDATGNLELHGTFGIVPANDGHGHSYANAGTAWELSGDIAFFANDGNPVGFATVRDCPNPPDTAGCSFIDTLIELDVPALSAPGTQTVTKSVRGQIVKSSSCSDTAAGYGSVYGIGAWGGVVYGFSRSSGDGFLIEMSNVDGTACLLQPFPGFAWAGAGNTTAAPIIPPPS